MPSSKPLIEFDHWTLTIQSGDQEAHLSLILPHNPTIKLQSKVRMLELCPNWKGPDAWFQVDLFEPAQQIELHDRVSKTWFWILTKWDLASAPWGFDETVSACLEMGWTR